MLGFGMQAYENGDAVRTSKSRVSFWGLCIFSYALMMGPQLNAQPLSIAPSRFFETSQMPTKATPKVAKKRTMARQPNQRAKKQALMFDAASMPLPQRNPAHAKIAKVDKMTVPDDIHQAAMKLHETLKAKAEAASKGMEKPSDQIMNAGSNMIGVERIVEGVVAPLTPLKTSSIQTAALDEEESALEMGDGDGLAVGSRDFLAPMPLPMSNLTQETPIIDLMKDVVTQPIRTVLPAYKVPTAAPVLGDLFADSRVQGDPFSTPRPLLTAVGQALKEARLTTASIGTSSLGGAGDALPDVVEKVIFGYNRAQGDQIFTGSINTAEPDQRRVRFAQNSDVASGVMDMQALLSDGGALIKSDLVWRIFAETADPLGEPIMLHRVEAPRLDLTLPYGNYVIHVSYGLASAMKTVLLAGPEYIDNVVLNAGGLKVDITHAVSEGFDPSRAVFDVYPIVDLAQIVENVEPEPLATSIQNGGIVRLNSGSFRVVSRYGKGNSVVEAQVRVEPGRLVEAGLQHQSGEVTFKLAAQQGGPALANTQWTILTPSGDLISESVGALSRHILAIGDYQVIASNGGDNFSRGFSVSLGQNPIVEVVAQ